MYSKGLESFDKKFNFEQFIIKSFNNKKLNKIQQQSIKNINKYLSFNEYSTTLLHGITGSGKTLVYFHYIKEAITKGFQVLVLLPEIALTKQISDRFKEFIGHEPATWHSGIKDKDKKLIWNGSRLAALRAGQIPKKSPTNAEKDTEPMIATRGKTIGQSCQRATKK